MTKSTIYLSLVLTGFACQPTTSKNTDEQKLQLAQVDSLELLPNNHPQENTKPKLNKVSSRVTGRELVDFGRTLLGTPYSYASSDPATGFDCSGFITYVFSHFNIVVPRSSIDFTNAGEEVDLQNAKEGDLILFTGTVDSITSVGHMGIVTENLDTLKFIHSTSGKANGVTISLLNEHYKKRFVKITRVLSDSH